MLPGPLVPPLPSRPPRRARRRWPWLAISGVVLTLAGVVGTIVWFGALSPYGFIRFSLAGADRTITVSRAGTYLVFEEHDGAARSDLPTPLEIAVVDELGRSLPVESLLEPGERGAPYSYDVPPNEGRAVARFEAPRSGLYLLQVEPFDPGEDEGGSFRDELPDGLAVGRELGVTWLRTPVGLVVLGLVPLAAGTMVMVHVIRRRRRRSPSPPIEVPQVVR